MMLEMVDGLTVFIVYKHTHPINYIDADLLTCFFFSHFIECTNMHIVVSLL